MTGEYPHDQDTTPATCFEREAPNKTVKIESTADTVVFSGCRLEDVCQQLVKVQNTPCQDFNGKPSMEGDVEDMQPVKQEPNNSTCLYNIRIKEEPVSGTELEENLAISASTTYPGKSEIKEEMVWDPKDIAIVEMYPNADVDNKQSPESDTATSVAVATTSAELSPSIEATKKTRRGHGRGKKKRQSLNEKCSICCKRFPDKQSLDKHITCHKFICDICDQSFKHSSHYEGHLREHAGEKNPYWCEKCERKYPSCKKLSQHMWKHGRDGQWKCSQCQKMFTHRDPFNAHMKVHSDPASATCKICHIKFARVHYLRRHMVLHKDEKPFECVVCDTRFNFRELLVRHMRVHTGESLMTACKSAVPCEVCGNVFRTRKILEYHMTTHTGERPYACRFCDKTFAQASTRMGHETTHGNTTIRMTLHESKEQLEANINDAFPCKSCLFSFISQSRLDAHVRSSHQLSSNSVPKNFECDICERSYTTLQHVKRHKKRMHSSAVKEVKKMDDEKPVLLLDHADFSLKGSPSAAVASSPEPVECRVCGKKVSSLSGHMRTHKERAFICRVCGMKFTFPVGLKRHLQLHTGEKISKPECPICGKIFTALYKMKLHKASHASGDEAAVEISEVVPREKKYKCDTCGKMFLDNSHLNRHMNVHRKGGMRHPPL